jgi:hypothetical protein
MIAVGMVQVSIDQIIHMVPVWHRLMSAAWSMMMRCIMSATAMLWRTAMGILRSYPDHVFLDLTALQMMEMAAVEIIDVALMLNRGMTATGFVDMRMIGGRHGFSFRAAESSTPDK